MPELPEVETIRMGLEKKIVGRTISKIEILKPKSFTGNKGQIIGAEVGQIRRRAKILIFDLDNGQSLVVHLKLTGQLVWEVGKKNQESRIEKIGGGHPVPPLNEPLPNRSTRVIFTFENGDRLYFNDLRIFGYIKVVPTSEIESLKVIQEFGPEPFGSGKARSSGQAPVLTEEKFTQILQSSKSPVKIILMDQTKIAGVGNIYANEALFLAGIDPRRKANEINEEEAEKLYKNLLLVLKEGIKYGGSSDNTYVNALGEQGKYQDHFLVYGKTGKDCPRQCGGTVKRIVLGGRGTFFCPSCQK